MLRDILRPRTLGLYYVMLALAGGALAVPGNGGMVDPAHGAPARPKLPPSALAPGGVTTLRADAVTDTSIVLSWVEVNSGTTTIARYVIRAAPITLQAFNWSAVPDVLTGGCAAPVYGSTVAGGRTRSCVLTGLKQNTGYEVQLVAYTGQLNLNAVFGPFSNLLRVSTAQRIGPMLVLRPRMFLDTLEVTEASLPADFGPRRYPLHGKFPAGDRVVSFYDSTGALMAFGYLLIVKAP